MIIMSMDYGMANSGISVIEVSDYGVEILFSDTFYSNKELDTIPRILSLIEQLYEVYKEYNPNVLVKESPFIGRASTAKPVIYAHAILELTAYKNNVTIEEIHNASLKAYCRKYLIESKVYSKEELKQFDKKQVVAEFLKVYFDDDMKEIYTKRGKLKDDQSDAIALGVMYKDKLTQK